MMVLAATIEQKYKSSVADQAQGGFTKGELTSSLLYI
jgi:hypothetical protein